LFDFRLLQQYPPEAALHRKIGVTIMELALYSFLSDKKARECRADIGLPRGISAGAAACDGRASRCKRQRPIKLAGIHFRQRAALDPSDCAQREQQRRLKAVACPDRIHHVGGRRLDLRRPRCTVPRLGSLDPPRDDNETRSGRHE
jgi:hypothetical protein